MVVILFKSHAGHGEVERGHVLARTVSDLEKFIVVTLFKGHAGHREIEHGHVH
jgi:hypothetical protein